MGKPCSCTQFITSCTSHARIRISTTRLGSTVYCHVIGYYTQIGLAVGDTEQERQKAEFTKLKAWVGILE